MQSRLRHYYLSYFISNIHFHGIQTANEVLELVKLHPNSTAISFSQTLPCVNEMIANPNYFSSLSALNQDLGKRYYKQVVNDFFAQKNPSITTFIRLSACYADVKFNDDERKDFLFKLDKFLRSTQCNMLMKLLSQKTSLALFRETAHQDFNDIVSSILYPRVSSFWVLRNPITLIEPTEVIQLTL